MLRMYHSFVTVLEQTSERLDIYASSDWDKILLFACN